MIDSIIFSVFDPWSQAIRQKVQVHNESTNHVWEKHIIYSRSKGGKKSTNQLEDRPYKRDCCQIVYYLSLHDHNSRIIGTFVTMYILTFFLLCPQLESIQYISNNGVTWEKRLTMVSPSVLWSNIYIKLCYFS
jgi:hypothetical protein